MVHLDQICMLIYCNIDQQLVYTMHNDEGTLLLFVCFVAFRPKSTAMVMAGRSVHLTTHFPGQARTDG